MMVDEKAPSQRFCRTGQRVKSLRKRSEVEIGIEKVKDFLIVNLYLRRGFADDGKAWL